MTQINKRELMLMGARSRLVELESEKLQLLKMFPELDLSVEKPTRKRARRKRKVTPKRRKIKPIAMTLLARHDKVTPKMLAEKANIDLTRANNVLYSMMTNDDVKRISRGVYGKAN